MKIASFFLLLPSLVAGQPDNLEDGLASLGSKGLNFFDFSYKTEVDSNDMYTLTMTFSHEPTLPLGDSPEKCSPLEVAEDGLGFLSNRWYFDVFDDKTKTVTGFDHTSFDYNACGHPPGGFLQPHYDVHYYTITPEERLDLTCDVLTSAPVCDPNPGSQSTSNGQGFFEVARLTEDAPISNMPLGFEMDMGSGVPFMGTHVFHTEEAPATPEEWNVPVLVYCTHNSKIVAFESMFPFHYNHGDQANFWDRSIEMVNQDVETLPTYHSVAYDPSTKITTLVVKGKSAISQVEFGETIEFSSNKPADTPTAGTPSDGSAAPSSSLKSVLMVASVMSVIVNAMF